MMCWPERSGMTKYLIDLIDAQLRRARGGKKNKYYLLSIIMGMLLLFGKE